MTMKDKVRAAFGMVDYDENEMDPRLKGIHTHSCLAYVGDAKAGHMVDVVCSQEAVTPTPVIFYFNSSMYKRTNRGRASDMCRVLAKRNYVVVNAEVRDIRGSSVKDEVDDLLSMMRWTVINKDRFDMDLGKVYVMGSGYGALLAVWMTLICRSRRLQDHLKVEALPFNILGLGLFNGMTDTYSGDDVMMEVGGSLKKLAETDGDLKECLIPWENHDIRQMPPLYQVTSDFDPSRDDVEKLDRLYETNGLVHDMLVYGGMQETAGLFAEKKPLSNQSSRAISRMLTFFQDLQ